MKVAVTKVGVTTNHSPSTLLFSFGCSNWFSTFEFQKFCSSPKPLKFQRKIACKCAAFMRDTNRETLRPGHGKMGVILPASEAHVNEAVMALKEGHVIAVPTDTLYGFACHACSPVAIKRIYEIKGRSSNNPLAICIADISDIKDFAEVSHIPDSLLNCLLPGPVTLVLERGKESMLEKSLNPGMDTIGVRIPECEFIRKVAHELGSALALTSANQSGQPSTVSVKEFEHLWQQCAFVFDGGQLPLGRAGSTVVDLTRPKCYRILREGSALIETQQILEKFGYEENKQ
eukprot:TRINITY_DN35269_c0_g1_i1.p1 TRINITY_DN35269_c0_g1~~TRINITY_DN35269_c0_g1_i1.p1  ORF type:complete len:288 (-),score=47.51 TRINITY_DN35269_c0_g1_i1:354-1217(-)